MLVLLLLLLALLVLLTRDSKSTDVDEVNGPPTAGSLEALLLLLLCGLPLALSWMGEHATPRGDDSGDANGDDSGDESGDESGDTRELELPRDE